MKLKLSDGPKKELFYIGCLFVVIFVVFRIIFYNEVSMVIVRAVFALFWMFLLPGYAIMLYWSKTLDVTERSIIGVALSAAITGMGSYYIGLLGLNIKYHYIIPLILIAIGVFLGRKELFNQDSSQNQ